MSSIRSVLIRTCMSNIQKEISQLEHWLTNLPEDSPSVFHPPPMSGCEERSSFEQSNIFRFVEALSSQISKQDDTLNNILERLDSIEGGRNCEREVYINEDDENKCNDPWLDNQCEPLQNEVVSEEYNISEPLFNIKKNDVLAESSVSTPSIIPNIPEDRSMPPDILSDCGDKEEEEGQVKEEEEEEEEQEEEEEEEEEVEEEEDEEEEVEEEQEEVEEEEEEDGLELEEIEYNKVKYYKDAENFIYSIDKNDEPSENPIGYWKDKTNTIAFYKSK